MNHGTYPFNVLLFVLQNYDVIKTIEACNIQFIEVSYNFLLKKHKTENLKDEQHWLHKNKPGVGEGYAISRFPHDTRRLTHIVKTDGSLFATNCWNNLQKTERSIVI
jgi:hypothetical protein